jgi:hypothetical protein
MIASTWIQGISIYGAIKIISLLSTFYKRPIIKKLANNNEGNP